MNEPPFETLCLAGMSTKALLALGATQFLRDTKRLDTVKHFVGTSSGAMIAFFLIIGYTPADILSFICVNQILEKLSHFNIVAMMNGQGATSWSKLQEIIEKMTVQKIGYLPTLKSLKDNFDKSLTVVTFNLTKNQTEYISDSTHPELPVLVALRMTANLPFVFEKYQYRNNYFIDGGCGVNFPLKRAEEYGGRVIGIRVSNPKVEVDDDKSTKSFLSFVYRVLMLPIGEVSRLQIAAARSDTKIMTLSTEKVVKAFDFKFSNKEKMDMFSNGYQQMRENLAPPPAKSDEGNLGSAEGK